MNQFSFPTTILHGEGALADLSDRLAEKKLMLVTDPGLVKAGVVEHTLVELKGSGVAFEIFDGVHPNPYEEDVESGSAFYNEHGCDGLLALGGGSAGYAAARRMVPGARRGATRPAVLKPTKAMRRLRSRNR